MKIRVRRSTSKGRVGSGIGSGFGFDLWGFPIRTEAAFREVRAGVLRNFLTAGAIWPDRSAWATCSISSLDGMLTDLSFSAMRPSSSLEGILKDFKAWAILSAWGEELELNLCQTSPSISSEGALASVMTDACTQNMVAAKKMASLVNFMVRQDKYASGKEQRWKDSLSPSLQLLPTFM